MQEKNTDIGSTYPNSTEERKEKRYVLPSGLEITITNQATSELVNLLEREKEQAKFLHTKLTAKMDEIEMYHKKTFKKEIKSLIKFPEGYKKNRYNYDESSDSYFYSLENFVEDLRILLQFYQKAPDKIVKSLEIFEGGDIKVRYQDVKTKF